MLIGATIDKTMLDFYASPTNPKIPTNNIMRVFPSPANTAASWTDSRLLYCKRAGVIPFFSAKTDGDAAAQDAYVEHLYQIPDWCPVLYATNRHEPEGDQDKISRADHLADFTAILNKINARGVSDPGKRARIKFGHVNTKQWTESSTKGKFDYGPYDTGLGDFFGIDAYMDSNKGAAPSPATEYKDPTEFLKYIKAYKKSDTDTRPRILVELGAIGLPGDTTGSARGAWIQGLHNIVKTWNPSNDDWLMPWTFAGWIWWNDEGTGGSSLTGIGTRRWFNLDRRHNGQPYAYKDSSGKTVTDPQGGYSVIPNSIALSTFNAIVAADGQDSEGTPEPDPDPTDPGDPDPTEPPDDPVDTPPDDGGEAPEDPENPGGSGTGNRLVITPEPNNTIPRVRIDVSWTDSHLPTSLYRTDLDGQTTPVRGTESGVTLGSDKTGIFYDYESPFGAPFTYTAEAETLTPVTSRQAVLEVGRAWLRHPGIPSRSQPVQVEGDGSPVRRVNRSVLEPVGRAFPVVVTDGRRKKKTATITFRTTTLDQADALLSLLEDASILLLDVPVGWKYGITHQYMAIGDVTENRVQPKAFYEDRDWEAEYQVVERPVSGVAGARTWVNVLTESATWKDVRTKYRTWVDLINGRQG